MNKTSSEWGPSDVLDLVTSAVSALSYLFHSLPFSDSPVIHTEDLLVVLVMNIDSQTGSLTDSCAGPFS